MTFACDIGAYESTACVNAPPGLVGWWPLDETSGTIAADISGAGHHGTHQGDPAPTAGKVAGALSFNGSTDYVEVPDHPDLNFGTNDNFSIDAWVNVGATVSAVTHIVGKGAFGPYSTGYSFFFEGEHLGAGIGQFGFIAFPGPTVPFDGSWHHVAVVVDRSSSVTFYIDGGLVYEDRFPTVGWEASNNLNLRIGLTYPNSATGDTPFAIDELEIFNRALTPAEIRSIYNAGSAGKCEPPLLWPVTGQKLLIVDNPDTTKWQIVFVSKDQSIIPRTPSGSDDPRCSAPGGGGGSLWVFGTAGSGQRVAIPLPCENWQAIGKPTAPKGYRYRDKEQDQGPCKLVEVKKGKRLKAVCTGKNPISPLTYDLTASGEGSVGVVLSTGTSVSYCADFQGSTGTVSRDDETLFKANAAPAPAGCPMPPP